MKKKIKVYNSIGSKEKKAAERVIKSGILSDFLAKPGEKFLGGKYVRKFEKQIEKYFNVKYAITVNSWTSGLIAAVGAIGIEPGDEVIVTPFTMSATATAILHWNAIPVFADIERDTYNIDPQSIEKNISPYTKAILAVDIFGHPANFNEILKIAKKYKLKVISDSAQAIGAKYFDRYAGTLSDVGGFSLNCHKQINTGEGGILVTNNFQIAKKLRLIRNHAEAIVQTKNKKKLSNMIGYNFKLGEIESAIGIEQLKKLSSIVRKRQKLALKLINMLKNLKGLRLPIVKSNCSHAFYGFPILIDTKFIRVKRKIIYNALKAQGVEIVQGYSNLHLLPIFQNKIAYGTKGFPWTLNKKSKVRYKKGICPIAEDLNDNTLLILGMYSFEYSFKDIEMIGNAFKKVWKNLKLYEI